jgi:beta-glucosidase
MKSAAARALRSGVDFDLPNGTGFDALPEALDAGLVTEEDVDRAVRRMLELKFAAGLFDEVYADADYAERITDNAEARALALKAAQKSIILLKNDGVLPLEIGKLDRIAVVGPNAAAVRLGGYSGVPNRVITMLDGIEAEVGDEADTIFELGVGLTDKGDWNSDEVVLSDRAENLRRIEIAKRAVADADVILLFIGGSEATSREAWSETHLGDRTSIELIGEQEELARAMFATGKPVVVVLINGRPLGIDEIEADAAAIIEGWYLGQEGGTAMADVLFGKVNPGGKLPVTIPRDVGQLPLV